MPKATQLDELLVISQPDAIIGPHAMMVHYENTLVANATVVRPQWLNKLAAFAKDVFLFIELSEGIFKCLKVCPRYLTVPENFSHIRGVSFGHGHVYR